MCARELLGELPSWDMSYQGAGDKNDIMENPDAGNGLVVGQSVPQNPKQRVGKEYKSKKRKMSQHYFVS